MQIKVSALALSALMLFSLPTQTWAAPTQAPVEIFTLAQATQSKTIAVVDFNNDTGDKAYDNLKRGISESLMTKLARRPELTLVERGQLAKAIKELGFSQSVYADSSQAKEIGKMTGASYLVTGDVIKAGERFEINVRMLDVQTAKVLVSESYNFQSENDILPVVDYLSLLIPKKLGLYVSDREIDMAKNQLRASTSAVAAAAEAEVADNTWIWWTTGGLVVAAAIIGVALYVSRPQVGDINQRTRIITTPKGSSTTVVTRPTLTQDIDVSLFSF